MLRGAVPQILGWLGLFRRAEPAPGGEVDLGAGLGPAGACISEVADIEEMVWAPRYGLKGMVDASVGLRLRPRNGAAAATQVSASTGRFPGSWAPARMLHIVSCGRNPFVRWCMQCKCPIAWVNAEQGL